MLLKLLLTTTLLCTLLSLSHCDIPINPLDEAGAHQLMQRLNVIYWQTAKEYQEKGDYTLSPEIVFREQLRPFYGTLEKYDWKNFKDPLLKRQFVVILRGAKYPPINSNFRQATNTLKSIATREFACVYEQPQVCNVAFLPDIWMYNRNTDDQMKLQHYWKEWRIKLPLDVKEALHDYVSYYQNISTTALKPSAVWYEQYEDANFLTELEQLIEEIRPFYREMHANVRNALRAQYGRDAVPQTGLIPYHLFEQISQNAWLKEIWLQNPFPAKKLPNMRADLVEHGFKPLDLVNISAQYFASMGFESWTDEFMQNHFSQLEHAAKGPDCKSHIIDFGEVSMKYCPKVHYKKLLQTHGDMAQFRYALAKNSLSVGLNEEACPGFGNAMGEAVILSVSNPKHLQQKLGLLKDYNYDEQLNMNRLYRLAVHSLLTIPTYFVHEKLWVDMIDGKIAPHEYSCHYWNLMQKYMGVDAPVDTSYAGAYDMPHKFYEGLVDQSRSTKKLLGEFLGYQLYRDICLNIDEFERGNPNKVLHNCDFANNHQAGQFLRNIMSAGSTKPWRELIKPLTRDHQAKLSASGFLEFFEPLQLWLKQNNLRKRFHVGWQTSDKCKRTSFSTPDLAAGAEEKPY